MMLVRTSKSAFRVALFCVVLAASWLVTRPAKAEEMIIKHPGDHPNYSIELEPHLLAAFFLPTAGDGYGLGGRFTVPLMKNGFVSSINNNVGIGFGLDWIHYSGCYYYNGYYYGPAYPYYCPSLNTFLFPVVMQWNFFLSTHWSVFAEPGLAIYYQDWNGNGCVPYYGPGGRYYGCEGPDHLGIDPFIFFVGGRFHFSESVALTLRIGWPYASIGVSFMP
jgi:hypothetical protein